MNTLDKKIDKIVSKIICDVRKNSDNALLRLTNKLDKSNFKKIKDLTVKDSEFEISEIKNFYYFKSKRWDVETNSGILIKLPKDNLKNSLNLSLDIINNDKIADLVANIADIIKAIIKIKKKFVL